jgi:transposase
MLPNDFPPPSTVQRYFYDWRDSGLLRTINHHLVVAAREAQGREASPSAGVIDSQSVKTTEFPFAWRTQLDETVMVVRPAGRLVLPWCERARY